MKRRNYESDFVAKMTLPQGIEMADFEIEFATGGIAKYRASRKNAVHVNCKTCDDGTVLVIFKNHGLSAGMLRSRFVSFLTNGDMPDGVQKCVTPRMQDIELVRGPSDDSSDVDVDVLLGYAIQDLYAIVRAKGYNGTESEFYATWVDLLANGGGGSGLTEVKVSDVKSDDDASVNLGDILRGFSGKILGKADTGHTHSGYATTSYVQEQIQNVDVDTNLFYDKTAVDALVEAARVSLNLTNEQLAGLNVNLTPIQNEIAEVNMWSVKGKKMLVIGDSLSSANGGSMEAPAIGSWCAVTKAKLGLGSSISIASGGATIKDKTTTELKSLKADWTGANNVFSNQVYSVINHYKQNKGGDSEFVPDIIIIMGGTNDTSTSYQTDESYWNRLFGDWDTYIYKTDLVDKDYDFPDVSTEDGLARYNKLRSLRNESFYFSYRWMIEALLYWFPNTYIYIATPLSNGGERGISLFSRTFDAVEKLADYYSCGFLDTARRSGMSNYTNNTKGNGWSDYWYTYDGTHPNDKGKILIGNYVAKAIKSSYFDKPAISATRIEQVVTDTYYTITVTDANNDSAIGVTSPIGANSVIKNGSLTVTFTPASGYKVYSLMVDNVAVANAESYTFSDVTENHTILVEYALTSVEVPKNPPVLSSIAINSGATTTSTAVVSVKINTTGGVPTHYRIAESSLTLSSAGWVAYSSAVSYTLGSYGSKTIYVQVKNADGESDTKFATITYNSNGGGGTSGDSSLWTSKIGLGWGWMNDTAAATMVGDSMKLHIAINQMNIYSTTGETVGTVTKNVAANTMSQLKGKITGDDSALLPDALLQNNFVSISGLSNNELILTFVLAAGTYNVKTLHNISSEADWANYVASLDMIDVTVNDVLKHPAKIVDNTDTWLAFENVVVDGNLILKFKTNDAAGRNIRSSITGIIIEKTA